jgi:O-antigen/teichoic acid export membrane protein
MTCYLLGGSVVVRSYLLTITSVLQALERFALESVVVSIERLMLLILGVLALTVGYGLTGLALAFVLSRIAALVVAGLLVSLQVGRLQLRVDLAFWRELQISALPFGLFLVVLNLCSYIDTVMLGVLRNDSETGVYNAAYRIYEGLAFVPPIISTVLNPRLAKHYVHDHLRHLKLANAGLVVTVLLGVAVGALVFAFAGEAVTLLFGQSYMAATGVLQILVVGLVFVFPIWVLHAIVISINRERLLLGTAFVSLGANVVLNFILIPLYGMHGAAIATLASEFISFCILFHKLRALGFFRIKDVGQPAQYIRFTRV